MMRPPLDIVRGGILGLAVGDALGVPVEFKSRAQLANKPVKGMVGFGTHEQPAGTWSDDASLALCTAESLCGGYNLHSMSRTFVNWLNEAYWTPYGRVFDVGHTTRNAIIRLEQGFNPEDAGLTEENDNGNGSLMRILPVALYFAFAESDLRKRAVMSASRITHGHMRSQLACVLYSELVSRVCIGMDLSVSLAETRATFRDLLGSVPEELAAFHRTLDPDLGLRNENEIMGSGYVIHTLEASIWCCLRSKSFKEAVLRAINLGEDTDTTGAVTGGLAGILFGIDDIPSEWISQLARVNDIEDLCGRFAHACAAHWQKAAG